MFQLFSQLPKGSVVSWVSKFKSWGSGKAPWLIKFEEVLEGSKNDPNLNVKNLLGCFKDLPDNDAKGIKALSGLVGMVFGLDPSSVLGRLPESGFLIFTHFVYLPYSLKRPHHFVFVLMEKLPNLAFRLESGDDVEQKRSLLEDLSFLLDLALTVNGSTRDLFEEAVCSFLGLLSEKDLLTPQNLNNFIKSSVQDREMPTRQRMRRDYETFLDMDTERLPYQGLQVLRAVQFFNLLGKIHSLDQSLYDLILSADRRTQEGFQALARLYQNGFDSFGETFSDFLGLGSLGEVAKKCYGKNLSHMRDHWFVLITNLPDLLRAYLAESQPKSSFASRIEDKAFVLSGVSSISPAPVSEDEKLLFYPELPLEKVQEVLTLYQASILLKFKTLRPSMLAFRKVLDDARKEGLPTVSAVQLLRCFEVDVTLNSRSHYFVMSNIIRLALGFPIKTATSCPRNMFDTSTVFNERVHLYQDLISILQASFPALRVTDASPEHAGVLGSQILLLMNAFGIRGEQVYHFVKLLSILSERGLLSLQNVQALNFFYEYIGETAYQSLHPLRLRRDTWHCYDGKHFRISASNFFYRLCLILIAQDASRPLTQERFDDLTARHTTPDNYVVFKWIYSGIDFILNEAEQAYISRVRGSGAVISLGSLERLIGLYWQKKRYYGDKHDVLGLVNDIQLEKIRLLEVAQGDRVFDMDALHALGFFKDLGRVDIARHYIIVKGIIADIFGYFEDHVTALEASKLKNPQKPNSEEAFLLPMMMCLLSQAPELKLNCGLGPLICQNFQRDLMGFLYVWVKHHNQSPEKLDLGDAMALLKRLNVDALLRPEILKKLYDFVSKRDLNEFVALNECLINAPDGGLGAALDRKLRVQANTSTVFMGGSSSKEHNDELHPL